MEMQIIISCLVHGKPEEGELVGSPYDRLGAVHVFSPRHASGSGNSLLGKIIIKLDL